MSSLLAGDLAQALAHVPPSAARTLANAAPVAFARGFAAALTASGVLAAAAIACKLLAQPMRDA